MYNHPEATHMVLFGKIRYTDVERAEHVKLLPNLFYVKNNQQYIKVASARDEYYVDIRYVKPLPPTTV